MQLYCCLLLSWISNRGRLQSKGFHFYFDGMKCFHLHLVVWKRNMESCQTFLLDKFSLCSSRESLSCFRSLNRSIGQTTTVSPLKWRVPLRSGWATQLQKQQQHCWEAACPSTQQQRVPPSQLGVFSVCPSPSLPFLSFESFKLSPVVKTKHPLTNQPQFNSVPLSDSI